MSVTEFAAAKALGERAERALMDILTGHGAVVILHQQNRDATHGAPGAAMAHLDGRAIHLADMTVLWPTNPIRQFSVEVKAKKPLNRGGWGLDVRAFDRAVTWAGASGDPVLYVIRDRSNVELPPEGEPDDPYLWWFASIWKLQHSPNRSCDGQHYFWPESDFLPLPLLLTGEFVVQAVPCIALRGEPPLLL